MFMPSSRPQAVGLIQEFIKVEPCVYDEQAAGSNAAAVRYRWKCVVEVWVGSVGWKCGLEVWVLGCVAWVLDVWALGVAFVCLDAGVMADVPACLANTMATLPHLHTHRHMADVVACLAELTPRAVASHMSQLLPYLGCHTYSIRSAIVHIMGSVLAEVFAKQVGGSTHSTLPYLGRHSHTLAAKRFVLPETAVHPHIHTSTHIAGCI